VPLSAADCDVGRVRKKPDLVVADDFPALLVSAAQLQVFTSFQSGFLAFAVMMLFMSGPGVAINYATGRASHKV